MLIRSGGRSMNGAMSDRQEWSCVETCLLETGLRTCIGRHVTANTRMASGLQSGYGKRSIQLVWADRTFYRNERLHNRYTDLYRLAGIAITSCQMRTI